MENKTEKYESINIDTLIVSANPGSNLIDGLKECVILSMKQYKCVRFNHNGYTYWIDPDLVMKSILGKRVQKL